MSNDRIVESFARQALTMTAAAVFNDRDVLDALAQASGQAPGRRCIDVGCGPGIVVERLARCGGEVVGIDATPEMVRQAQERCRQAGLAHARVNVASAETLPFPDRHFDAAVSRATLHHVQDPFAVVAEMARVVRPGGRLVLVDIVCSDEPAEGDLHNALEILRDPSHTRMLPRSEFLRLGQAQGLHPIETRQWVQHRELREWVRIVNAPQRQWPLGVLMSCLAQAGRHAGIALQCDHDTVTFDHHLWMVVLQRPDEAVP